MKIKILKGEYLFSELGTHVIDDKGFALKAEEDCECEVLERVDFVKNIIVTDRFFKGLDEEGNPIPPPASPGSDEEIEI